MAGSKWCGNCGRPGHDSRTCSVPANKGRCSKCGYRGHSRPCIPFRLGTPVA